MTEFSLLLDAKYPNQKSFTREEFDSWRTKDDRHLAAMMESQSNNQTKLTIRAIIEKIFSFILVHHRLLIRSSSHS